MDATCPLCGSAEISVYRRKDLAGFKVNPSWIFLVIVFLAFVAIEATLGASFIHYGQPNFVRGAAAATLALALFIVLVGTPDVWACECRACGHGWSEASVAKEARPIHAGVRGGWGADATCPMCHSTAVGPHRRRRLLGQARWDLRCADCGYRGTA